MRRRVGHALRRLRRIAALSLVLVLGACAGWAWAAAPAAGNADWQHLSPMQREALAPLQREWPRFSADRKRKWLNIAARYPAMSPQQRQMLQRRMVEWVHMSPRQRRIARET
ncbi:DUF3106 domain-containing protein, partial [Metallibacterium scheffleri]|uniref:DUF3106 domain-containing protein n=1 Tax=Metallibacterium scheffleri TaxID=993689 RepID=UPI0026EE7AE6